MADHEITLDTVSARVADGSYSCTSMVVTVFGDCVSQHGGSIWLGSLIEALGLMGYSERLVRTAVYRLVQQDWLRASRIGRRSYYSFTDMAVLQYEKAARRIYAPAQPGWDGSWTLVAPVSVPDGKRELFRRSLEWQGYNSLLTGLYAHPSSDRTSLKETLREQDLVGHVLVFSASTDDDISGALLKRLAEDKWGLDELQSMYQQFVEFYRPLARDLQAGSTDSRLGFILRLLLVHEYRRILLRDPDFPEAMLPSGWPGLEAQALTRELYRKLTRSSLRYIQRDLENASGPMPQAIATFHDRYRRVA